MNSNVLNVRLRGRVGKIGNGIFRVRWSNRILSICDAVRRKDIVYIGFSDEESAEKFYNHILKRRPDWKWRFYSETVDGQFDGEGITRPRKSKRLTDYAYEVKWHRPPLEFIEGLIRWDNGDDIAGHELTEKAFRTCACKV